VGKPPYGYLPKGHPRSIWVREDRILEGLSQFFDSNVFGPHRRLELSTTLAQADERAAIDHARVCVVPPTGFEPVLPP
jgi:hypothetical protein